MSNDTTRHTPADVRELAGEIIRSLDLIARNYDSYEYGLPVMTHYDEMVDTVVAILRTPRGEGEAVHRDGAQGEARPRTSWDWMDYLECLLEDHVGAHDPATCCDVDDDEACCTTCALYRLYQRKPWRAAHFSDRNGSDGE